MRIALCRSKGASSSLRLCPVGSCAQCFLHDHVTKPSHACIICASERGAAAGTKAGGDEGAQTSQSISTSHFLPPCCPGPKRKCQGRGGVRGRAGKCAERQSSSRSDTACTGAKSTPSPPGAGRGKDPGAGEGGETGKSLQWAASLLPGWHPGSRDKSQVQRLSFAQAGQRRVLVGGPQEPLQSCTLKPAPQL